MEEKLIKEYVGKNSNEIIDRNLNWVSAILGKFIGPIWFFYRKSYLIGFLFIIFTLIVGKIAVELNMKDISIIMFIIYLLVSNKLYLWDVKRKVRRIMLINYNMSEEELTYYVREKGKPSIMAMITYVVVFGMLIVVYVAYMYILMYKIIETPYI